MERMSTDGPLRRRTQWKSCEDANLDRGIRSSVESAPQRGILRRKGARGASEDHVAGDESFAGLNLIRLNDKTRLRADRKLIVRYLR